MYNIATLNKISPVGLDRLTDEYTITDDTTQANGIIVRSQDMHDMKMPSELLAIARAGAGTNNIPVDKCAEDGIVVFNAPGANANSVKELVICNMIAAARNMPEGYAWAGNLAEEDNVKKTVEKGKSQFAGTEILGKTLGVIGLGAIGVLVANAAQQLGMKVIGYDPFISLHSAHELSNKIPVTNNMDNLLPYCDYITIHVPANDKTAGMIDSECFNKIKPGAVFLNFARDKLVDENAMLEALASGKLKRYVTDFPNDLVAGKDGVTMSPHLGASTAEAENNCAIMAADSLMEYIEKGNIIHSVNYPDCSMGDLNPDASARVCILNKNIPSMLGKITGILADTNINIRDLTNKSKGEYACTLMDIDSDVSESELKRILDVDGIIKVRVIK